MKRRAARILWALVPTVFIVIDCPVSDALADSISWSFDEPSAYSYDSSQITVSDGVVRLKELTPDVWFDEAFSGRCKIAIDSRSDTELIDYTARIDIDYLPSMQWDFDDIRFVLTDGVSALSYWLESYDSAQSSTFWVKIPSIPPRPDSLVIYMYYGNEFAVTLSDGSGTFQLFDDFSDDNLHSGLSVHRTPGASVETVSGLLCAVSDTPEAGWVIGSMKAGLFRAQIDARDSVSSCSDGSLLILGLHDAASVPEPTVEGAWDVNRRFMIWRTGHQHPEPNRFYIAYRPGTGSGLRYWDGSRWNRWITYFGGSGPATVQMWNDGRAFHAQVTQSDSSTTGVAACPINDIQSFTHGCCLVTAEPYTSGECGLQLFDNIIVQTLTDPEPGITIYAEEELPRFPITSPSISANNAQEFVLLEGFSEVPGPNNEGYVRYQISNDGSFWYWWNGSVWASAADYAEANSAEGINSHLEEFNATVGPGFFLYRAFLYSDGTEQVELDEVSLTFTPPVVSVQSVDSVFCFGVTLLNSWLPPQQGLLINAGTMTERFFGRISPFSDSAISWEIDTSSNGADLIRVQWSITGADGPWTDILSYDTDFLLASQVSPQDSVRIWLRLQTPTLTSSFEPFSSVLTVTAAEH